MLQNAPKIKTISLFSTGCRLSLTSGGDPAASAKCETFAAGSALKFGAFNQCRLPFDAAAFKIYSVCFFDIGTVAQAQAAETAICHACFKTGGCDSVFLGIGLPGRPEQLNDHAPDFIDFFRAGLYLESFFHGVNAGGYKPFPPALCFDLHHAHAAAAVIFKPVVMA